MRFLLVCWVASYLVGVWLIDFLEPFNSLIKWRLAQLTVTWAIALAAIVAMRLLVSAGRK
jgi:hypothetical protein